MTREATYTYDSGDVVAYFRATLAKDSAGAGEHDYEFEVIDEVELLDLCLFGHDMTEGEIAALPEPVRKGIMALAEHADCFD